jgi:CheY-like chemotaxis protein
MLAVTLPCVTDVMNHESTFIRCYTCHKLIDFQTVTWCTCEGVTRTVVCPSCRRCFCSAPLPYKRRFWSAAPRHVREHSERFRTYLPAAMTQRAEGLVLVVDDDEVNRSLVALTLESWGYRVLTAADGVEAFATCRRDPIDIVVTDALMPKMDGRELALRLKQVGHPAKVILMTSLYTKLQHRAEAFKTFRIDDFLVKPIKFPDLEAALKRVRMTEVAA